MNKPRHQYKIFWLLLLPAIYFIVGYLYAPNMIKQQIISQLADQFDMRAEIESVSLNPFNFNINLKGLTVTDINQETWFYSQKAGINFDPTKLLWNEWKFSDLNLVKPIITIHTNEAGQVLIPALPDFPEDNDRQEINFSIDQIQLTQGNIDFQADSIKKDFKLNLSDIKLNLDKLVFADEDTYFKLNITTENKELMDFTGSYNHNQQLIDSEIKLTNWQFSTLEQVLPDELKITDSAGTIQANGHIKWELNQNPLLKFSDIKTESLQGQFHNDVSIQNLNSNIQDVIIDTEAQTIVIDQIQSAHGAWQINWPFNYSSNEQISTPQPDKLIQITEVPQIESASWQLTINQTNIQNWSIELIDHDLNDQLAIKLQSLNMLQVNNYHDIFSLESQISFNELETINISSEQTLSPLNLQADLQTNQVSLQRFASWINAQSGFIIKQGKFTSEHKLTIKDKQLSSVGSVTINDGHIEDQNSIPIASWKHLQIGSTSISSQNKTLTFDHIIIDQSTGVVPLITEHSGINSINTSSDDWTVKIGSIDTAEEAVPE